MRRTTFIGALLVFVLCAAADTFGQTASVGISTDSVLVGEPFFFTVTVRADEGQVVIFPTLENGSLPIGDAEFLRRISEVGESASTDSATFEVAVFGVDSALVGGLPIGVIEAGGDTLFFGSPTVEVGIRSVVPPDAEGMKDLAPLATFPMSLWPWILGTALALAAVWFLHGYLRKRANRPAPQLKNVQVTVDPYDEAVNRLKSLADTQFEGEDKIQHYHDELSDILRTYIEKTLAVPALERTTGELLAALRQLSQVATDYVSEEAVQRVGETLGMSDLVKFANYLSVDEENRKALELARASIDDMENGRRRRMATAEVEANAVA